MEQNWIIPGTTLEARRKDADQIDSQFQSLFLAGGLTLSQVSSITGLEAYTIQNWAKRKYLAPPNKKRYNQEQLCRIIIMNMLKGAMTLEQITDMIRRINGDLVDESDDTIDDAVLYFKFVRLAARAQQYGDAQQWDQAIAEIMADYVEPISGAAERIEKVLRIMLTAWIATQLRIQTERMLSQL